MDIRHNYHINFWFNKGKIIVILFSCSSDFALYFEDYEGESISNQPNLFPVEIHLFLHVFDVIAL